VFSFAASCFGASTQIRYHLTDLGSGKWAYDYDITNINLPEPIEEFTIWFDYNLYENLSVTTVALDPPSSSWNEVIWQPEYVLEDDGGYDALALILGIGISETVSGFSVSFDWLGTGHPNAQFYEIINPNTYETIESGFTTPEPATLLLLGLGAVVWRRKR
jgi:hypothetical protein